MLCRDFVSVISTPSTVRQVEYYHYCAGKRNLRWQSRKPVSSPPLMNIPKSPLTVGQSSVKKTGTYQKRSFTIKVIKKAPQWGRSEPGTLAIIKSLIPQVDNPIKQKVNILRRILPPEWEFWASAHGSGTGKMSPQNIWLWRPVGINCRNPTGLGEVKKIFFFLPYLEGSPRSSVGGKPERAGMRNTQLSEAPCLRLVSKHYGSCWTVKFLERWEYQTSSPLSWETCMQVKKQQLEPSMEQLIGSRSRKDYDRAVSCHLVCLTYMLSISWEMPGWMNYKLESRQVGETTTTSDRWMIPLSWQKAKRN